MELWSSSFLGDANAGDWATCGIGSSLWETLTQEHEDARRLIAHIQIAGRDLFVAVGSPLLDVPNDKLYLAPWMLENLGIEGLGNLAEVDWLSEEAFPAATHIVLRPHDSAFHHVNAKEELERALTRMGVLKRGATILVPLEELGGYEVAFDVTRLEPAEIVLAEGEEVSIEFEEALDAPPAPAPPVPSAPPAQSPLLETPATVDMGTMLSTMMTTAPSVSQSFQGTGYRLGGGGGAPAAPRLCADGRPWNPWRDGPPRT